MAEKENEIELSSRDLAMIELEVVKIDPKSDVGKEFIFRAQAFGITNVQPPMVERNSKSDIAV